MLQVLTKISYVVHISGGFVGLVSGFVALLAPKGRLVHRWAGHVFFVSMLLMAVFAIYLAFVTPNGLINAFIGVFAIYLVGTAWVTVRRRRIGTGLFEKVALFVSICLCAPFVIFTFPLVTGLPPLLPTAIKVGGPEVIALYCFTLIMLIATVTDAKLVLAGGISGRPRVARHLWRMCLGLTLAAGSGFTNGLARLLPGPYHVPMPFFLPTFVPVGFLLFWMVRVRFTGWFGRAQIVGNG